MEDADAEPTHVTSPGGPAAILYSASPQLTLTHTDVLRPETVVEFDE